jgi:membrane protein
VLARLARIKERAAAAVRQVRREREWVDHLFRAGGRYQRANADYLAAGVTYFSFLSLLPLLLLAMSVAGYVLSARPDLLTELRSSIADAVPGGLGDTLVGAVNAAVSQRGTVGVVGLLGLAYAGMGWVANLRKAVQLIWAADRRPPPSFVAGKLADLTALAGLGLAALASVALTAGATAATGLLVRAVGLAGVPGMPVLTRVLGVLVSVLGDTLVFGWLLARLPQPRVAVPYRSVLKGALLAAVGFEILKIVGTYYVQQVSQSPTAAVFGNVIGLLVWINLVSRFLMYATAWTATDPVFAPAGYATPPDATGQYGAAMSPTGPSTEVSTVSSTGPPARPPTGLPTAGPPRSNGRAPRPAAVAGALVATGAVLGAVASRMIGRPTGPRHRR